MDIVSHGLYGGVAFGRKSRKLYLWAFGFGIMPDLFSFGIFTAGNILGLVSGPDWGSGLPNPETIPQFVHILYNITHSLVVFAVVFGLVWLLRKKLFIPILAWGLHILVDIPTHSAAFFPTPFLWPISNVAIDGVNWGQPVIFYPDIAILVLAYFLWWVLRRKKRES